VSERDDSIESLRLRARRRLPRAVFDFIDGGAESEETLRRNRRDFERIALVPDCFVDVAARDSSARLLAKP
jgi:(S)-mandelate dehydrogenase